MRIRNRQVQDILQNGFSEAQWNFRFAPSRVLTGMWVRVNVLISFINLPTFRAHTHKGDVGKARSQLEMHVENFVWS